MYDLLRWFKFGVGASIFKVIIVMPDKDCDAEKALTTSDVTAAGAAGTSRDLKLGSALIYNIRRTCEIYHVWESTGTVSLGA